MQLVFDTTTSESCVGDPAMWNAEFSRSGESAKDMENTMLG